MSELLGKRVDENQIVVTFCGVMRSPERWLFCLLMLLVHGGVHAETAKLNVSARHKLGDDPRWAARDWDDRDWERGNTVQARNGIYWVRFTVRLHASGKPTALPEACVGDCFAPTDVLAASVTSIFVAMPYAYEIFWDGQLIGGSGKVDADRASEEVGPLDNLIIIPQQLRVPGEHVIAIRLSSFHYAFPAREFSVGFGLGDHTEFLRRELRRPIFPIAGMGAALLVSIISAVLFWLVDRQRPLLLCSVMSFALAMFYLLIAWRWLHNDPFDWFYPRLVTITCIMTLIAGLFPWLLLEQFAVPRRKWWLLLLVPLLLAAWTSSEIYEIKTLWLCRVMLLASLVISAWAVWQSKPGARFILVGLIIGLFSVGASRRAFLDPWFFVTFDVLVVFVFTAVGAQLRTSRLRAREAMLTAARLEIELLKKNIQPHFLLNTLATIMEVIEQDPKVAVTLIEALAGEFRILAGVSDKKLIPLGQEIDLCRAHLRIMTLRKGAACSIDVAGTDGRALVPPALFHTLVENGLTHLRPTAGAQRFELRSAQNGAVTRYTFAAYGEFSPTARRSGEGTGLRYIKARLEESFAGRWKLADGPISGGWRTVIEITSDEIHAPAPQLATKGLPA